MEYLLEEDILSRLKRIESQLLGKYLKPMNLVEASEYLSLSQSHLYKLTSQKKIPFHKPMGKYLYFYKSELDEWIRSKSKDPALSHCVELRRDRKSIKCKDQRKK